MKKSLKIITIVLIVVLIMLISTLGIFKQQLNRMVNIVPDYKLASDLEGTRNYTLEVDNTENANSSDALTKENYEKVKSIMQERLSKLEVKDYDIRLNPENGTIIVSVPNDDEADSIYNSVGSVGKFEILDKETEEVLMTNDDLKNAEAVYYSQSAGTTVYLQLEFNKEGTEKLRKISTEYVEKKTSGSEIEDAMKTDEEKSSSEDETTISYVKVNFDGTTLITTYFGEEMTNGKLQIPISQSLTDTDTINDFLKSTRKIANILNSGKLPVAYKLANDNYVETRVSENLKNVAITAFEIVTAVLVILLIAKNGKKGLLGAISQIGFVSLLLLVLRYTNVALSISGCLAILFIDVLYFVFLHQFMKRLRTTKFVKKAFNEVGLDTLKRIVPIIIVSFVFTLAGNIALSSLGMVAFWGVVVAIIYSFVITRTLYKANED